MRAMFRDRSVDLGRLSRGLDNCLRKFIKPLMGKRRFSLWVGYFLETLEISSLANLLPRFSRSNDVTARTGSKRDEVMVLLIIRKWK